MKLFFRWQQLTKSEQKEIYSAWKNEDGAGGSPGFEAILLAMAASARAAARAAQAKGKHVMAKARFYKV